MLKIFKPITPSLRHTILLDRSTLYFGSSIKNLTKKIVCSSGHNNYGRITIRHRGKYKKKKMYFFRLIDYKRNFYGIPAKLIRTEYDPNRSSFIGLIYYKNGFYTYILYPLHLNDNTIYSFYKFSYIYHNVGFSSILKYIAIGTLLHNIELHQRKGGQLIRSAGCFAQLLSKNDSSGYAIIKLSSGENRIISLNNSATIGSLSNIEHQYINYGKAGRRRWLGYRPKVRGVAMNPIDHPHGGNTSGGKLPKTPWGKITKGKLTRKFKNKWISLF